MWQFAPPTVCLSSELPRLPAWGGDHKADFDGWFCGWGLLIGLRSDFVPSGPVEKYKGEVAKIGQRAGGHKVQDCQAPAHK